MGANLPIMIFKLIQTQHSVSIIVITETKKSSPEYFMIIIYFNLVDSVWPKYVTMFIIIQYVTIDFT